MTNNEWNAGTGTAIRHSSFVIRMVIRFMVLAIRGWQLIVSPVLTFLLGPTGGCRFTPSCSRYATEALREHGALAGTVLTARRICRCHPWGGCGHDPVPKAGEMWKAEDGKATVAHIH